MFENKQLFSDENVVAWLNIITDNAKPPTTIFRKKYFTVLINPICNLNQLTSRAIYQHQHENKF